MRRQVTTYLSLGVHSHAIHVVLFHDVLDLLVLANLSVRVKSNQVGSSDSLVELESLSETIIHCSLHVFLIQLNDKVHTLVIVVLFVILDK